MFLFKLCFLVFMMLPYRGEGGMATHADFVVRNMDAGRTYLQWGLQSLVSGGDTSGLRSEMPYAVRAVEDAEILYNRIFGEVARKELADPSVLDRYSVLADYIAKAKQALAQVDDALRKANGQADPLFIGQISKPILSLQEIVAQGKKDFSEMPEYRLN